MRITPEELKQAYRQMSDEELFAINRGELTDVARQCHDGEIERRGLNGRKSAAAPASHSAAIDDTEVPWVSAGTFRFIDEAELVRGLLQSAGIAAELESDTGDLLWLGTSAYKSSRVLVPETAVEDARAIIQSRAAEEELAAQAEAEPLPVVIAARYEDGVFKPLEPVDWEEGTEVDVRLAQH